MGGAETQRPIECRNGQVVLPGRPQGSAEIAPMFGDRGLHQCEGVV